MNKLWKGRFESGNHPLMEKISNSIAFDKELYREDIQGSIAHATMLGHCGIIERVESETICAGLNRILEKIESGQLEFSEADEDIHMNIERMLSKEIGSLAGKLHTGRSRNDQVATDLHLYVRKHVLEICDKILNLQKAFLIQIETYGPCILPGYTHLQRAQPVLYGQHLLAYVFMLQRDFDRYVQSWSRVNQLPLGAGALAGTKHAIDREYTRSLLKFDSLYLNSMDAVSDRDFATEFVFYSAQLMIHLSRLSEELILWSSQEFDFIEIADEFCSGSSLMPQKKNPDVPELIRGKSGRVIGSLMSLLTLMKGLPLSYNRDMQEDKEPIFDTVKTVFTVLDVLAPLIRTLKVHSQKMEDAAHKGFMNATDLADYLVCKNIPFREAHALAGKIVRFCIDNEKTLNQLNLSQFQEFSKDFAEDIFDAISLKQVVASKKSKGGTSWQSVEEQIIFVKQQMIKNENWIKDHLL